MSHSQHFAKHDLQLEIAKRIEQSNLELKHHNSLRIAKRNARSFTIMAGSILLFGLIAHIFMQI